ncbi:MAG: hypothetical protein ATN33_04290 [Epulopiscium sp. Nele67-Bin001]|nr:MAG: hypothetical protein BEN18_00875 [Epulopiscium sp. Nuni2H_MBin001]OON94544.1 MAG: hypothetical protein ATN33_04290 [Epulopiscium sp. Nele67-Bin001]
MEMNYALIGVYLLNRVLKAVGIKRENALMITWICLVFCVSWDVVLMFQSKPYERVFTFNVLHVLSLVWLIWVAINRAKESPRQLEHKQQITELARTQVLYWKDELGLEKSEALSIYYHNRLKLNDEYIQAGAGIILELIQEEYGDEELEGFWLSKYIV